MTETETQTESWDWVVSALRWSDYSIPKAQHVYYIELNRVRIVCS